MKAAGDAPRIYPLLGCVTMSRFMDILNSSQNDEPLFPHVAVRSSSRSSALALLSDRRTYKAEIAGLRCNVMAESGVVKVYVYKPDEYSK